jgi:hypothetical protein
VTLVVWTDASGSASIADGYAAADAIVLPGAGTMVARLVAGQHEFERLYGRSRGCLKLHRPVFRRVPGLPHDGMLTLEEETAIAVIRQHLREGGRP